MNANTYSTTYTTLSTTIEKNKSMPSISNTCAFSARRQGSDLPVDQDFSNVKCDTLGHSITTWTEIGSQVFSSKSTLGPMNKG